jgi:hypothetical protein
MRPKVQIDVTTPLKQEWKARVSNRTYATIQFKYEKLGIFFYLCGVLGHTNKYCQHRFEMENDDGSRAWMSHYALSQEGWEQQLEIPAS